MRLFLQEIAAIRCTGLGFFMYRGLHVENVSGFQFIVPARTLTSKVSAFVSGVVLVC